MKVTSHDDTGLV